MNNKISVESLELQEFLYKLIERGNKLYNILFSEKYIINREEDANEYIELINEYKYITDTLRELQIYNWLNIKLEDKNDIKIIV